MSPPVYSGPFNSASLSSSVSFRRGTGHLHTVLSNAFLHTDPFDPQDNCGRKLGSKTLSYLPKATQLVGLPRWLSGKESACRYRRSRRGKFNPWVRKVPGEGNGNLLQYSCLENSTDRGTWKATVRGIAKSWTPLSD